MAHTGESQALMPIICLTGASGEKLELAQHFIRCYTASRQGLTRLGILRSERSLQGDYAE